MEAPDTLWTQERLLEYTKAHLTPLSKRGDQFAYGDTGFLLVSMIMEKIEQQPLRVQLEDSLLIPLGMKDTQSMIYLYPKEQAKIPQDIWLDEHEVKSLKILSVDQADGGLVSTPFDLVLFQKALHEGKLINQKHLELMQTWQGKFRAGLHYGTGMMQVHFNEFFFLMRDFPKLVGHIGILSTHCFYDQDNDIHYILNFGSTQAMTRSFVFLSNVVSLIKSTLKK
jgi:D-alanyl-D-alanine carboxypeptidase